MSDLHILVTGGTGFIGRALCAALLKTGYRVTVLSRQPAAVVQQLCGQAVQVCNDLRQWQAPPQRVDAVINLAGAPIVDRPWTASRKKILWESRVTLTQQLIEWIAAVPHKPTVLLSGSAIGYYGDCGDRPLEDHAPAADADSDFGAKLCHAWEQAALTAERHGVRVCCLRTGLVLHPSGGLLQRMQFPFQLGLGAQLGSGKQWMSWIHRDDYVEILLQLLTHSDARGAYNLTAPNPVTNAEFTRTLANSLHRPSFLTFPTWLLQPLLGERAPLLLGGQRVLPSHVQAMGYRYRYPTLELALEVSKPPTF